MSLSLVLTIQNNHYPEILLTVHALVVILAWAELNFFLSILSAAIDAYEKSHIFTDIFFKAIDEQYFLASNGT